MGGQDSSQEKTEEATPKRLRDARKKGQVNTLDESIDLANQLFRSARAEYLEVLLTQREALEARMELVEVRKEQFMARIDLYRALGGGWN